ncbi:hypothetical protein [Occallatibacter riparius]|uniref:Uncharacterized protein n=1 Tax=Occallatibacter riparius TaxID=1002689 RepID=A0A9J7BVZ3_9BACT|nr:hypothetical protein [Occallatibacter riparius]UWZ86808.1 hypothetical protein MOP44_12865 [Occallatibacter riparius]
MELQCGRQSDTDADQTTVEQQTMRGAIRDVAGGAVCSIECCEQGIFAASSLINVPCADGADAESLVGLMTRGTASAIGPEALEKRAVFVNIACTIGGSNGAGWVFERLEVRDR